MTIQDLGTPALELGGAGLASLITWLFSSRRRLADVKKVELDNEQTATKIYKDLCDELRGEMDELRHRQREADKRLVEADTRIRQLEEENCDLRMQVHELKVNRWGEK